MSRGLLRVADLAASPEAARRIILLRPDWETQEKLAEWAKTLGFDLGWSYDGWPQASWNFDFHVTVVASENKVKIPDGSRSIDPLTLTPTGIAKFGKDGNTAAIELASDDTLDAIRKFFVATYGVRPTFEKYKPRISVSYRWTGAPDLASVPLPTFPLVFNYLMVAQLDSAAKVSDGAGVKRKALAHADRAPIAGTHRSADGYLITEARVARGGNIQDYYGHEIGEGEPNQVFKVWRPPEEIFKLDSLKTFAHKPVTLGHPGEGVTPANFKDTGVGHIGDEILRDGEFIRVPLVVMDEHAISQIEAGTAREISMGYDCELVMQAGTTPDGRAYDAYQTDIRINHCALVPAGRAGPQCRIGDQSRRSSQPQQEGKTMKVNINGKSFEVADDLGAAIMAEQATAKKVGDTLTDAVAAIDGATALVKSAKAEKEVADKAAKDAADALEAAKKATPTADQIEAAARERSAVIDAAKKIAPSLVTDGKSLADIRKAAVESKLGDKALDGKSEAYIEATFDVLGRSVGDADPLADAMKTGTTSDATGRGAYLTNISQAYLSA